MKVWMAYKAYSYEDREVIGIFATKGGGVAAVEAEVAEYAAKHGGADRQVEWEHEGDWAEGWALHRYVVTPFEVQP